MFQLLTTLLDHMCVRSLHKLNLPAMRFRPGVVDLIIGPRVLFSRAQRNPPDVQKELVEHVIVDVRLNRIALKGVFNLDSQTFFIKQCLFRTADCSSPSRCLLFIRHQSECQRHRMLPQVPAMVIHSSWRRCCIPASAMFWLCTSQEDPSQLHC